MSLKINLRQLEDKDIHLKGELPAEDLKLETLDELIALRKPLLYDLNAQKVGQTLLIQGTLDLTLDCSCARCLKPFEQYISLADWALHLPLEGDDAPEIKDDSVDLTPYIREDILLEFPQRPLCEADCAGLADKSKSPGDTKDADSAPGSPAWSELNKLKF
jgi:uncharacterized protein